MIQRTPAFTDFEAASKAALAFLHRRLGFDLWMVTRTQGEDWTVLQAEDHGYNVKPGTVFRWADSFCSEMVKGNGPSIAPRSDLIPAYATAAIGRQVKIKAYVGVPLVLADGNLFGTLCAIHPSCQPASIIAEQELVELVAAMLATILDAELRAAQESRRSERLRSEAMTDEMTGLYNRRAWGRLLAAEEERCRRFGVMAAVLVVDLDKLKQVNDSEGHAAGDALILRASAAINQTARSIDVVARLGGDEFGILLLGSKTACAEELVTRLRAALHNADVQASIGFAVRDPSVGLKGAWNRADQLMYEEKRSR